MSSTNRHTAAPLVLAVAAFAVAACGSPTTAPTALATTSEAAPDSATPTPAVVPLTLADLDATGLEAAGYQPNPEVASESVALWQTSDCTVQILVENVQVTGDNRRDAEEAFGALPTTYTGLAPHTDVELALESGGTLTAPAMTAHLAHSDGSVTPALVAMRVIGERESLLSITQWCWEHAVTSEDFDAALAGLTLGGGVTAP